MVESILRNEPEVDRTRLERTRQLMCEAVRDCTVTGYERPRATRSRRPPRPRRLRAHALVVVTSNVSDFPAESLDAYSIEAQSPDQFVLHLVDLAPASVAAVVTHQADALRNPPQTMAELLDRLSRNGLPRAVAPLREHSAP